MLPDATIGADPSPPCDLSDLLALLEGNLCNAALSLLLIFWWRFEHLSSIVAQLLQMYPSHAL